MKGLTINSDYAGGNISVVGIEGNRVKLEQEIRDTEGWWFYWNFCAESSRHLTIVFEFMNGDVIGPWGPAVSRDGVTWEWLGAHSAPSRQTFLYSFGAAEKVYFSFCIPYQVHHFESFYSQISYHPLVRRKVLVNSEQFRPVPLLLIGNPAANKHIMFTCRHHACESTPAYLLEGLLEYYLEKTESPILQQYLIHYVPFVDLDGVEKGDQGKSRTPHDHNRDYMEVPIYKSTKAIMNDVKSLNLIVGIDFHGPYKWGGRNDFPFIVKKYSPMKEENERFGGLLEKTTQNRNTLDKITYDPVYDIEMGEDWNQPHGNTCSAFFERRNCKLACTFEFPYFGADSTVFTQKNCRQFGSDFAHALESYLLDS